MMYNAGDRVIVKTLSQLANTEGVSPIQAMDKYTSIDKGVCMTASMKKLIGCTVIISKKAHGVYRIERNDCNWEDWMFYGKA